MYYSMGSIEFFSYLNIFEVRVLKINPTKKIREPLKAGSILLRLLTLLIEFKKIIIIKSRTQKISQIT
jgi:hypothetical protein